MSTIEKVSWQSPAFFLPSPGWVNPHTDLESRVEEEIRGAMSEFLPFINVVSIETKFSDLNINRAIVNIRFTLDVDLTSEENLELDLSTYTGALALDPHDLLSSGG